MTKALEKPVNESYLNTLIENGLFEVTQIFAFLDGLRGRIFSVPLFA